MTADWRDAAHASSELLEDDAEDFGLVRGLLATLVITAAALAFAAVLTAILT